MTQVGLWDAASKAMLPLPDPATEDADGGGDDEEGSEDDEDSEEDGDGEEDSVAPGKRCAGT